MVDLMASVFCKKMKKKKFKEKKIVRHYLSCFNSINTYHYTNETEKKKTECEINTLLSRINHLLQQYSCQELSQSYLMTEGSCHLIRIQTNYLLVCE